MRGLILCILGLCLTVTLAKPPANRIVGGSLTTINNYPYAAVMLYSSNLVNYYHGCGGSIITTTAILSAAHCFYGDATHRWRIRVGSSYASSGGTVHQLRLINNHPRFNSSSYDNDVAVLRTSSSISYIANTVQPGSIAGSAYNLGDNQVVWAIGWGRTTWGGSVSEQLRHVQIWSVNQNTCVQRMGEIGWNITPRMVCSGWLDVGGRDQCQGDSGGPLIHNGVIVGVCSFGERCALARYPGVNARVSSFTSWIRDAAD